MAWERIRNRQEEPQNSQERPICANAKGSVETSGQINLGYLVICKDNGDHCSCGAGHTLWQVVRQEFIGYAIIIASRAFQQAQIGKQPNRCDIRIGDDLLSFSFADPHDFLRPNCLNGRSFAERDRSVNVQSEVTPRHEKWRGLATAPSIPPISVRPFVALVRWHASGPGYALQRTA